ncbi:hypothetical protein [Flavivirga eckloniae]|uniref:Uncharacterized protein n=1 Tax=Flavivirga eckloniae TaxID=1803846 RepID=A0A2K9PVJ6_9FLAO|nr:hypothetical protein [Flavivirga eckloniae]AUP81084.1 hypothetical protein C1H87_21150 [Flavivirga eckloniae]
MKKKEIFSVVIIILLINNLFSQNQNYFPLPTEVDTDVKIEGGNIKLRRPITPHPFYGTIDYRHGIHFYGDNNQLTGSISYLEGPSILRFDKALRIRAGSSDGIFLQNNSNTYIGFNEYGNRGNEMLNVNGGIYASRGDLTLSYEIPGGFIDNNELYEQKIKFVNSAKTTVAQIGYQRSANNFNESLFLGFNPSIGQGIVIKKEGNLHIGFDQNNFTAGNFMLNVNGSSYVKDNIAIGTTDTKGYALAVAGKAIAEEVKVALEGNWPDYVFQDDYNLTPISEVANYIRKNGHLKNIPSKDDVIKNEGINLGEINVKLLEKIEELTLYTINQEEQLKLQQHQIDQLKKLVNDLLKKDN